jgi:cytochrome c oxidase assembly protein subunit 15
VVLYKDQIGIFHAALAQGFFVLVCAIALLSSGAWRTILAKLSLAPVSKPLALLLGGATALIFCQLVLGATMRHQHAGLAIPDFPLAYGKVWPAMDADSVARYNAHRLEITAVEPITATQIGLQMAHRLGALLILGAVSASAWLARRRLGAANGLSKLLLAWVALILVQALLGAVTIWSGKAADIATAHVVVGALSLALGALATMVVWRAQTAPRKVAEASVPSGAWEHVPFAPQPAAATGLK